MTYKNAHSFVKVSAAFGWTTEDVNAETGLAMDVDREGNSIPASFNRDLVIRKEEAWSEASAKLIAQCEKFWGGI